jgi:hypothetical protein
MSLLFRELDNQLNTYFENVLNNVKKSFKPTMSTDLTSLIDSTVSRGDNFSESSSNKSIIVNGKKISEIVHKRSSNDGTSISVTEQTIDNRKLRIVRTIHTDGTETTRKMVQNMTRDNVATFELEFNNYMNNTATNGWIEM